MAGLNRNPEQIFGLKGISECFHFLGHRPGIYMTSMVGTWNPMNLKSQDEGDRLDLGSNHTSILYVVKILGGHFSMAIFCEVYQR